jgi:tetratricopeptide (TPR) repeat protein
LLGGGKTDWEKQSSIHREGIDQVKNGNFESARVYFQKALLQRPYDALSYVMMGKIALENQEPERALFLGSKALRLDNSIWQGHILMSQAFYSLGDYANAMHKGRNAVWFGRDSSEAFHWYGKILLESGEIDKGLEMMAESYRLGEEKAGLILRKKGHSQNRN